MSINIANRALALTAVLLLLAGLAGCSGAAKGSAKMDNFYERETDRLFNGNDRQRRGLPGVEDDDLANDPRSLEAQGDGMALNGDFEGALFVYNRAMFVAEKEQRLRLMGKAGELTLRQGRYTETRGILEKLTKVDTTNANAWQTLGLALLSMDEKEQAKKALSKAVAFNPNLWKSHNALGIIYNHDKQPYKALMSFNKAIQKGPSLAELFNNRALAYLLLKNLDQAEADWRRALAIKTDFKLAHNNLAILQAKKGDYRAAYGSFAKGSGKAEAHNNMGVMLAWRGKNQKAAKEFDQALKQLPLYYPKANSHLSQVAGFAGGLEGPMVVDLTEDGYLVPADYRSPGPGPVRRASRVKTFAKKSAALKNLSGVTPGQSKKQKLKPPAKAQKAKAEKAEKIVLREQEPASEKAEPADKAEAMSKETAGPASKGPAPHKELDLSRFSAPQTTTVPAPGSGDSVGSLLRAKPAAEPALAAVRDDEGASTGSGYPAARKVAHNDGKRAWRGNAGALFHTRD